MTHTDVQI